jgi:hypothetical protein
VQIPSVGCRPLRRSVSSGGYIYYHIEGRRLAEHRLALLPEHTLEELGAHDVHHRSEMPADNRPDNLVLVDRAEHMQYHMMKHPPEI